MRPDIQEIYDWVRDRHVMGLFEIIGGFDDPFKTVRNLEEMRAVGILMVSPSALAALKQHMNDNPVFASDASLAEKKSALFQFAMRPNTIVSRDMVLPVDLP